MDDIPQGTFKELADSLDQFSDSDNPKEYWRLLVSALPQKLYTAVQIETFADEIAKPDGSPSLALLKNLRARKFSFDSLMLALEKINCVDAQNLFKETTVPKITEQPYSVNIKPGSPLKLTCKASCKPSPPKYQWFFEKNPLMKNANHSTLKFDKANISHSGVYQCRVVNNAGRPTSEYTVWSQEVTVEVLNYPIQVSEVQNTIKDEKRLRSPSEASVNSVASRSALSSGDIEILVQPKDVECRIKERFTLTCEARSHSGRQLCYTWITGKTGYKDTLSGQTLEATSEKKEERLPLFCRVSYADEGDGGIYVDSKKAYVTVQSVWFEEQPRLIMGRAGERAELRCKAGGKPPIEYLWFKVEGKNKIPKKSTGGSLVFKSLGQSDWGTYVCQAQNHEGFIPSVQVKVEYSSSHQSGLHIISQPKSYVCSEGGSVVINSFKAGSSQPIHYEWYRKTSSGHKLVDKQDHLMVSPLTKEDCGTYYCIVKSGRDSLTSHDFEIALGKKRDNNDGLNSTQVSQKEAEFVFETMDGRLYTREKLALLIGNQTYEHDKIQNLHSSHNDVLRLKKTLVSMGFKVFAYSDVSFKETMKILEMFTRLASHPGIHLVFYYSGHGFIFHNVEYIMPVDACVPIDCDQCVSEDLITTWLKNTRAKVYILLDCCRSIYTSEHVQPPAQQTTTEHCGYANHCKILACSKSQPAYERLSEECSMFNEGIRKAFADKTQAKDLSEYLLEYSKDHGHSKRGREFQRPEVNLHIRPSHLTLHEPFMWDDWTPEMSTLEQNYKKAHDSIPDIDIQEGMTSNMVSGHITFNRAHTLTNELTIKVSLKRTNACKGIKAEIREETNDTCMLHIEQTAPVKMEGHFTDVFTFCVTHLQRVEDLYLIVHLDSLAANGEQHTADIPVKHTINIIPTDFLL